MTIIRCMVPEMRSTTTEKIFSRLDCSLPFYPPMGPENFFKKWKKHLKILSLYKHKWQMMHGSSDMECNRQNFLSFWTTFCSFTPLTTQKNQNFEKIKKLPGDIIILHRCNTNNNHMIYGSWGTEHNRQFFVILDHFLPFYSPNSPKNQNFKKMKKTSGDIIILHMCI